MKLELEKIKRCKIVNFPMSFRFDIIQLPVQRKDLKMHEYSNRGELRIFYLPRHVTPVAWWPFGHFDESTIFLFVDIVNTGKIWRKG